MVDHYEPSSYYEAIQLMLSKGVSSKKASAPLFEVDFYSQKAKGLVDFGSYEDYLADYVTNAVKSTASNPTRTQNETPETRSTVRPVIEIASDLRHPFSPVGTISADPAFSQTRSTPFYPGKSKEEVAAEMYYWLGGSTDGASAEDAISDGTSGQEALDLQEWLKNADPAVDLDLSSKLNKFGEDCNIALASYQARYGEDYYDTYKGDAGNYFATFNEVGNVLEDEGKALINELEASRSTYGDEWTDNAIAAVNETLDMMNQVYISTGEDAAFWAQFANDEEYHAAQPDIIVDPYSGLGAGDVPTAIELYTEQRRQGREDAIKELEKQQDNLRIDLNEAINITGDTEKAEEIQSQIDALTIDIREKEVDLTRYTLGLRQREETLYYQDAIRAINSELDDGMKSSLLSIPALLEKKIELADQYSISYDIDFGMSVDAQIESIDVQINGIKQGLRNRGYTEDEIDFLVEYATVKYNRQQYDETVEEARQYAEEHPVSASVGSVFDKAVGGLGFLDTSIQKFQNWVTGDSDRPIDYYTSINALSASADATRAVVSQKIAGAIDNEFLANIASFLYNTGMSMADFAAAAAVGAVTGFPPTVTLGSSQATSTMIAAHERGATDFEALASGFISGVTEAVLEKFSLGKLMSLEKGGMKQILKNIGKQSITEGSEEVFTSIANIISDSLITGSQSQNNVNIMRYMYDGMSAEEAEKQVALDNISDVIMSALGGMFSGGVMGGSVSMFSGKTATDLSSAQIAINNIANQIEQKSIELNTELAKAGQPDVTDIPVNSLEAAPNIVDVSAQNNAPSSNSVEDNTRVMTPNNAGGKGVLVPKATASVDLSNVLTEVTNRAAKGESAENVIGRMWSNGTLTKAQLDELSNNPESFSQLAAAGGFAKNTDISTVLDSESGKQKLISYLKDLAEGKPLGPILDGIAELTVNGTNQTYGTLTTPPSTTTPSGTTGQGGSMNLTADESRAVMEDMVDVAVNGGRSGTNPATPLENTGNTEYNGNQSNPLTLSDASTNEGAGKLVDNRPYLDPKSRPSFRKGLVEAVWNRAKGIDGLVRDPNTNDVIDWIPGQTRKGVWDMGHIPDQKYQKVHQEYLQGKMTPKQFRDWYNNFENYRPEFPHNNRGHLFE